MISALLLYAVLPHLASLGTSPQAADLAPFSVPAADSAAVRQIYGIGVFANAASKASVSVDSGILRAEFDLASDSTEGYTANVGLNIPLTPDRVTLNLGNSGGAPMIRFRFDYRLSAKVTDELNCALESDIWGGYYASLMGAVPLAASTAWKSATLETGDFGLGVWYFVDPGLPYFDSALTRGTALRIEPKTLYSESGFQKGTACTKCVNPTMKRLVMELRDIRIDRLGPAGDTISLVLGQSKSQVGVARRTAFIPADISWQNGLFQIANPARWTSVAVLGLDGRRLRTLAPSASQRLDLPPGSYRVLLRGRDESQAVRNLIQLH